MNRFAGRSGDWVDRDNGPQSGEAGSNKSFYTFCVALAMVASSAALVANAERRGPARVAPAASPTIPSEGTVYSATTTPIAEAPASYIPTDLGFMIKGK